MLEAPWHAIRGWNCMYSGHHDWLIAALGREFGLDWWTAQLSGGKVDGVASSGDMTG